jgi:hypothetical protein
MSTGHDYSGADFDYGDGEPVEFSNSEVVTARKPHRCDECRATIHPGQKYERYTSKYDGDISTTKSCSKCIKLRELIYKRADHSEESAPFVGCLYQTIEDHVANVLSNVRFRWAKEGKYGTRHPWATPAGV